MDFELQRHPMGQLVLRLGGAEHAGVVPVRAFPLSAPDHGLSLVGSDGRELVWIERLEALPVAQRALLEEELSARDFQPEVQRLLSVSTFSTPSIWRVETDRGTSDFVLKSEEDIRRLPDGGLLIASGQGVHYRVRDRQALDRPSRRLLERFL
ncbi:DUF1854 domain-containing protein [Pseudorhodoferax soli]|uniref:Uncharacterized protein DUF1854 n=1 Tax=Pseudorhodoferax soli TaxID=545864 RepID=A0A368Y4F0_9BURK|nr:DUF1854 domain-containing protein [Pseudorhodoferax soli]RCW74216.1 uncharacterized protein DUF1854 [Pseudorhodoferax soli]